MTHRYYVCPVIGVGTEQDMRRPKVFNYPTTAKSAAIHDGKSWCIVRVEATSFAAIDADPECIDVFEKLSDVSGTTRETVLAWLKSKTFGDFSNSVRNRIKARLTSVGVPSDWIVLSTPLWDVAVRVFRELEPTGNMEDM